MDYVIVVMFSNLTYYSLASLDDQIKQPALQLAFR
jgi:hypothetical protein